MLRALFLSVVLGSRLAAQASSDDPLDRAVRAYKALRTVRARFEQTLTNPLAKSSRTARGEFLQGGPTRFALRFTEPAGDAIVSDGDALWLYLPSTVKGQVIKMPLAAGAGMDFLGPLLTAPRTHYDVKPLPGDTVNARATAVYALTPKAQGAPFTRATLWVGRADALLWQIETEEPSELVRRVRFTSVLTDVDLPSGALAFTVPEGVRVIDQRALLQGKP